MRQFHQFAKFILLISLVIFVIQLNAQSLPGISYSSWIGNTYGGKNSSTGSFNPNDPDDKWIQNYIDCMLVEADGTCYTTSVWDEAGRKFGIYKNGDVLGNENRNITCGTAGGFTISGTTISGNGKTILDAGKPTAISMGRGIYAGKLLVADNGQRKQILIYDVSTSTPSIVETLGVEGGIASDFTSTYEFPAAINAPVYPVKNYPPGFYHPLKLWGLTGVGCDDAGRIFVSTSEMGTSIRCFKKVSTQWILDWRVEGYFFVDNIGYDEDTDALEIYGTHEHMKLDLDKSGAGNQWSIVGYTLDSYTYPEDPRGIEDIKANGEHMITSVETRVINGTRYLWTHGMTCQPPVVYKFKANTDIAVPCGMFFDRTHRIYDFPITYPWPPQRPSTNVTETLYWSDLNNDGKYQGNEYASLQNRFEGGDFYIDKTGALWQGGNPIKIWKPTFEANGNLIYTDANIEKVTIAGVSAIGKLKLQEEYDRLVILTEACRNIDGGKMYIIDNWSTGNRTAKYVGDIKGPHQSSWTVAGDYAFEVGWETRATVWVTDLNSGNLVGTMIPDASTGGLGRTGWVDIASGIKAYKRIATDEYLIFVEDDGMGRVILYRWCPSGKCLTGGGSLKNIKVNPESSSIKTGGTQQFKPTFSPANADNRNITWSSNNTAVATVDQNGLVSGISEGLALITVTAEDGGLTAAGSIKVEAKIQATYAQTAINIDGKIDEAAWVLDHLITKPTFGTQNNTGYFDLLWDENYLYLAIKVADAKVSYPKTNPWENDGVEVYLDGNHNKGSTYDNFDIQLIQAVGSNVLWTSRPVLGTSKAIALIDGGYSMEMAIPWGIINKTSVLTGSEIGFDIAYNDNDTGNRDGATTWNGDGDNFFNTSKFDDLLFLAGTPATIAVSKLQLDIQELSIDPAKTKKIIATVSPINASNKNVTWTSANTSIATVDQNGLVSALTPGQSVVTAKTVDGNLQAVCAVTVTGVVTATEDDVRSIISAYPNPVIDGKISLSGVNGSVDVKIYNEQGKVMFTRTVVVNDILEIDDLNLNPGLYFLSIQNEKKIFKVIVK